MEILRSPAPAKCECRSYGPNIDPYGFHFLHCPFMRFPTNRHDALSDCFRSLLSSCGFRVSNINPKDCFKVGNFGLLEPDVRVFAPGLINGVIGSHDVNKDLLLDITVINPLCPSHHHWNTRYKEKVEKYKEACAVNNHVFLPLVFEACGKFHPATAAFFHALVDIQVSKNDRWGHSSAVHFWNRRISVIIQRNNAIAISTRFKLLITRLNGSHCLMDDGQYTTSYDKQLYASRLRYAA